MKPRYQDIKDSILAAIRNGTYPPGAKIPPENQLAESFSVSRMTANRAIKELVSDGFLTRQQGLGTFVELTRAASPLLEVRNIAEEIRERHNVHSSELLQLQALKADAKLAWQLGISEGDEVFHSLIVHKENGQPLQLAERYVNARLVPAYLEQNFEHMTPNEYLSALYPLSEIEHSVEAILPSPAEQKLLQIGPHEPCLLVNRRTWSADQLISFARLVHPGKAYRLHSRAQVG